MRSRVAQSRAMSVIRNPEALVPMGMWRGAARSSSEKIFRFRSSRSGAASSTSLISVHSSCSMLFTRRRRSGWKAASSCRTDERIFSRRTSQLAESGSAACTFQPAARKMAATSLPIRPQPTIPIVFLFIVQVSAQPTGASSMGCVAVPVSRQCAEVATVPDSSGPPAANRQAAVSPYSKAGPAIGLRLAAR